MTKISESKPYRIRKLWLYFRYGHSTYISITLSMMNFILLSYRFIIEPNIENVVIINNLTTFAIVFLIIYIPVSILIGYWHRKTQIKVDLDIKFTRNIVFAKTIKSLIDLKLQKSNKEEIDKLENLLKKIEERGAYN